MDLLLGMIEGGRGIREGRYLLRRDLEYDFVQKMGVNREWRPDTCNFPQSVFLSPSHII